MFYIINVNIINITYQICAFYYYVQRLWFYNYYCKAQPFGALLGYPFHNTAAHTEATPTREGI